MSEAIDTAQPNEAAAGAAGPLYWLRTHSQGLALLLTILAVSGITAALEPAFLRPANLLNILGQISVIGILAVGMTVLMIGGGIDLSVGALLSLLGVVAGSFLLEGGGLWWVLPMTIGLGAILGSAMGLLVAKSRVQPFVITLGGLSLYQGLALLHTDGRQISLFLDGAFRTLGTGRLFGIPITGIVFLACALVAHLALTHTRVGRNLFAIGDNEKAAYLTGLPVDRYKIATYAIMGALAGLAGIALSARIGGALPVMGSGMELSTIAAVVIGGVSLFGGRGSIAGAVMGVILLGIIQNSLNLLQVPAFYQQSIVGLIILVAVTTSKGQRTARI